MNNPMDVPGLNRAIAILTNRKESIVHEYCIMDYDTGAWECPRNIDEVVEVIEDCIDLLQEELTS